MHEEQLTKKQRRLLKKEEQRQQQRRESQKKKLKKATTLVGVIVIIGLGVWFVSTREIAPPPGERVTTQGNQHISNINAEHIPYNTIPPTSGPHIGSIAAWGISDKPIPDELQVHNLEDGGVGVQYNCTNDCENLIQQLEDIVNEYDHVFMAPYPTMEDTIALTAWNRIDVFDVFDEERVRTFIEAYEGRDRHARF